MSLFPLFYVIREFHRFLHRGKARHGSNSKYVQQSIHLADTAGCSKSRYMYCKIIWTADKPIHKMNCHVLDSLLPEKKKNAQGLRIAQPIYLG